MIGTISFVGTQWARIEILIGLDWFNSVDLSRLFGCAGAWRIRCTVVRK